MRQAVVTFGSRVQRGPWTAADDAALRRGYGALDLSSLALVLGRSQGAVERRVRQLRRLRRSGPWTSEDLRSLRAWYGTRDDRDLELCLGRGAEAIAAKAAELQLAKSKDRGDARPGSVARMPRWTAADVALLRELYSAHDSLAVARRLGRSVTSVANKAHRLGLSKSPAVLRAMGRRNVALRGSRSPDPTGDGTASAPGD
jgi:hypothetical protein